MHASGGIHYLNQFANRLSDNVKTLKTEFKMLKVKNIYYNSGLSKQSLYKQLYLQAHKLNH